MHKDNMDGLYVTIYFALVATMGPFDMQKQVWTPMTQIM